MWQSTCHVSLAAGSVKYCLHVLHVLFASGTMCTACVCMPVCLPVQGADAAGQASEGQSQASSARRHSRATSDNGGSEGGFDDAQSYVSGEGSRSGMLGVWFLDKSAASQLQCCCAIDDTLKFCNFICVAVKKDVMWGVSLCHCCM